MKSNTYKLKSEVWLYPGHAGWHFISVNKKSSAEIKKKFGHLARGWGSFPVVVTLGKSKWNTSIFPDKRTETYLLPLKSQIRKKEGVWNGDTVSFSIEIKV